MREYIVAVSTTVFCICLAIFRSIAGPFEKWDSDTLASLGTFVGGTLGPIALVAAFWQYLASEIAQKEASKQFVDERHLRDLRSAIDRRMERLDGELDDKHWTMQIAPSVSLRQLVGTALAFKSEFQVPNFQSVMKDVQGNPDHEYLGLTVILLERLSSIARHLNLLKDLSIEYDKIVGSNIQSGEIRRTYYHLIKNLKSKEYDVDDWLD